MRLGCALRLVLCVSGGDPQNEGNLHRQLERTREAPARSVVDNAGGATRGRVAREKSRQHKQESRKRRYEARRSSVERYEILRVCVHAVRAAVAVITPAVTIASCRMACAIEAPHTPPAPAGNAR